MKRRLTQFDEALFDYTSAYEHYKNRLIELGIATLVWEGMPASVDTRFLEVQEFYQGATIFFEDEVLGYLTLCLTQRNNFGVYGDPDDRVAYSPYNSYRKPLTFRDSVIIWNNVMKKPSCDIIYHFAMNLAVLDLISLINLNAQKTPILVRCSEKQRLTLMNLYQQYAGNIPFIFADKSLNPDDLKVLTTNAPFLSDKVYDMKTKYWNEALTYLGISNTNVTKKERMVADEVSRNMGGVFAFRNSRISTRKRAADQINRMFGLDVSIHFYDPGTDMVSKDTAFEEGISIMSGGDLDE